jgi:hypothetical protein
MDGNDGKGTDTAVADRALIDKARRALGLRDNEVMAATVKDSVATIVTIGAHKVRYRDGDKVKPLHPLHAGRSIKPVAPPKAEGEGAAE